MTSSCSLVRVVPMAEAQDLNPDKPVVVPDLDAGCSLADGCPPDAFAKFIGDHPGAKVLSYINCSAEVKAMSHVICTSASAVKMVQQFEGEELIFAPDLRRRRAVLRWGR
jgi:quinolinate synthase